MLSTLHRAYTDGYAHQQAHGGSNQEAARANPYQGKAHTQWMNGFLVARLAEEQGTRPSNQASSI